MLDKNKLESIRKQYENITKKLSDSEIFLNMKKFQELSRRQKEIEKIKNKYDSFIKINKQLEENLEIIKSQEDSELTMLAEKESEQLMLQKKAIEENLKKMLKENNSEDKKNIIVEIRAGAGGDEAGLFAAELFRMYARFAEKQKWQTNILNSNKTGVGGFKEIIFEIIGDGAYGKIKYESGVHRVQRIPETEKSGRIHTSTATVAVIPEAKEIEVKIKPEDLKIDVFRSSGPGGQSVNTTDSAVRITYLPDNITVSCQDEKSQLKNKEKAMRILRSRILANKKEQKEEKERKKRQSQIGTGDRSEKIRTYNFPQDRITDHRIKKSWHAIEKIMDGGLDEIINAMKEKK